MHNNKVLPTYYYKKNQNTLTTGVVSCGKTERLMVDKKDTMQSWISI